ncbi:hypothetical protein GJ496_007989 [Pomphorhynchus laevis]|nr:hypothetical protein GJ496_007989 [Pomphorhynchus laevis]
MNLVWQVMTTISFLKKCKNPYVEGIKLKQNQEEFADITCTMDINDTPTSVSIDVTETGIMRTDTTLMWTKGHRHSRIPRSSHGEFSKYITQRNNKSFTHETTGSDKGNY